MFSIFAEVLKKSDGLSEACNAFLSDLAQMLLVSAKEPAEQSKRFDQVFSSVFEKYEANREKAKPLLVKVLTINVPKTLEVGFLQVR